MSGNGRGRNADMGPAALVQSATVARRYYLDGASKSEIAAELQVSRFKVARILKAAREAGVVRIEIDCRGDLDLDRSAAVAAAYGLRHCLVVDCPEPDDQGLRAHLGAVAARLLAEIVDAEDVLGVVWARSLMAMRGSLGALAPCAVVQLTGSLAAPGSDDSAVELVREIARAARGPAFYFYAPMIVSDAATAHALRAQPEIARALSRASEVTKAVVGVGAWRPGESTVADAVGEAERLRMYEQGVRAEVGGIQLDADGRPMRTSLTDRVIGVDASQLVAVPEVIAIAYGASKADAVHAALRGGLVKSLVTHTEMATALLDAAEMTARNDR
jgi:DNA-binding transcriptional regulator LsrR (DeoR family)